MNFFGITERSRAVSLLTRGILYICLAIFPLVMVYVELVRFFELELVELRDGLYQRASHELLELSDLADDARFFHLVCKKEFSETGSGQPQGERELQQRVARLKKAYPGVFSFIFWNKNGELMASLSDETRYSFLAKKLNQMLSALQTDTRAGRHFDSGFTERYNKELRILRQFLGPFVTPEGLTSPFVDDSSAACFQLHARGDRTLGWYENAVDFSVLVFISEKARGKLVGPRLYYSQLTNKWPEIDFYLFDEQKLRLLPEPVDTISSNILVNFGKFRKLVPREHLESNSHHFAFQKLNERWWGVAAIDKSSTYRLSSQAGVVFARLIATVLIMLFVLSCYFMVHENPLHSVRSKLIIVFAYTVFIPALVFAVVGTDYLKQKEKQVINDQAAQSSQLLTSLDSQFKGFQHGLARELNSALDEIFAEKSKREINKVLASASAAIYSRFSPDTLIISDSSGKDLLNGCYSKTIKDDLLRKTATRELIAYLNSSLQNLHRPSKGMAEGFLLSLPLNKRRLLPFTLNNTTFMFYLNPLRSFNDKQFSHVVQVFWHAKDMHFEFFTKMAGRMADDKQKRLFISFPETGRSWPNNHGIAGLPAFFDKVRLHGPSFEKLSDSDGKSWLAVGQTGTSLDSAILTILLDYDLLQVAGRRMQNQIWSLTGWSILITVSLFYILSHFLLLPIRAMATGVEMVKNRKYSYRINMRLDNEFGRLSRSIDDSLENLQELEIAQTVQESLLPQESLDLDNYLVVARTRSMTSLGGDYYDYVVDSRKNAVVLMADVAGHGIQAALLMAMAKSVLLLNDSACAEPETIMTALNRTFYDLRKSDIATMMTGLIVSISCAGELNLLNAGHCPPLMISGAGLAVSQISGQSLPFGFAHRRKFERLPVDLSPGDTLILYSDGILESTNRQGKMLGEGGFAELAKGCYDSDCNRYIDKLFSSYEGWADSQQDDITFVLIRRKEV